MIVRPRYLILIAVLGVVAAACGASTTTTTASGATPTTAAQKATGDTIEVVLTEFAFEPDPLVLPAGETVTLTLRNEGAIEHEWMVGGEPHDPKEGGGYAMDVLAMLAPEVVAGEGYQVMGFGDEATADDHDQEAGDHHDEEAGDHHDEEAGDHHDEEAGHDGHDHGAMVLLEPGGSVTLRLTIPEDAVGTWEQGCFVSGHYEAGMHGVVEIVSG